MSEEVKMKFPLIIVVIFATFSLLVLVIKQIGSVSPDMDFVLTIVTCLSATVLIFILALTVYLTLLWNVRPSALFERQIPEHFYMDPRRNIRCRFPSLHENPTVTVSVIIPCFNEGARMGVTLSNCMEKLAHRNRREGTRFSFEVIIVDDGSSDQTQEVALRFVRRYSCNRVRLLTLMKRRGKGGAIRMGIESCRGEFILCMDADGSVRLEEIDKLFIAGGPLASYTRPRFGFQLWQCPLVVCGSRAHLEFLKGKSFLRRIVYKLFQAVTRYLITDGTIEDTQCGFKLFTRSAARMVISNVHVEGWSFDVEVMAIIRRLNIPFGEIPIDWTEMPGSKLSTLGVLKMAFDVFVIWIRYRYRKWQLSYLPVLPHFAPRRD